MIEVRCPHCSAASSWPERRWGENARCPSCRKVITVVSREFYEEAEAERERLRSGRRRTVPVRFLLENVRSAYNVGGILRTADGCGVEKVYLCGITPSGDNPKVEKTALGAERSVEWEVCGGAGKVVHDLKRAGWSVYAVETADGAGDLLSYRFRFPALFMLGNEVSGLSGEALDLADEVLAIPMLGIKGSLNVASSAAVCGYSALLRFREYEAKGGRE